MDNGFFSFGNTRSSQKKHTKSSNCSHGTPANGNDTHGDAYW